MKKVIITILLVTMLAGCGCQKKEEKENIKTPNEPSVENPSYIDNEEMVKDQEVGTLKFTNTAITYDGNMTKITSQVTNTSSKEVILPKVMAKITYKDKNGNEKKLEMSIYFGEVLKGNESRMTENTVDADLRNSTSIEYQIMK